MKQLALLGPFWVVLAFTVFIWFTQGCSNGGDFARTEKPTTTDEEPQVVVVRQAPTTPVVVPIPVPVVVEIPYDHAVSDCTTCCYTIEEIQTALSECKDEKKKDHAICMYDKLFEYHNHTPD